MFGIGGGLNFEIKIIAENIFEGIGAVDGVLTIFENTALASGRSDQSFVILRNGVGGKAHGVIEIIGLIALIAVTDGDEFKQVMIADGIFCEQNDVT